MSDGQTEAAEDQYPAVGGTQPEELVHFDSGATRSADVDADARYDLIPACALRRLAKRYGMGAKVHGDRNWEGGIPASVTYAHIEEHLHRWADGDDSDDNLAAAAWGCFALMFYSEHCPHVMDAGPRVFVCGEGK